jgi:ADP-ribosyl-[dinitrogen reductase] hydrolase
VKPDDEIRSRARGCFLGLAVGDALGAPFEYQQGPIAPPERFLPFGNLPAGSYTDDTQLSILTAESILERKGLDEDDLAGRFARALEGIRGIGVTTKAVLEKIRAGEKPRYAAEAAHLLLGGRSAGNGAIMRIAPIAIAFWNDIPRLSESARAAAAIVHFDKVAHSAAEALGIMTALLLSGATIRTQALAVVEALFVDKDQCVAKALRDAASASAAELRPDTGFVLDTLTAAVWAFIEKDTFKECVQAAVSLGGDADTTAAVTGALAGAAWGADAIPEEWRKDVENSKTLISLADRLVDFALASAPL